jgi:hypothetical protein
VAQNQVKIKSIIGILTDFSSFFTKNGSKGQYLSMGEIELRPKDKLGLDAPGLN